MESVNQTQPPKTPSAMRNCTPSADIITPNYNLPQFNKPHSPPLPPSPSSEAVKRRKILNQNRQNHQTRPATPATSGKQPEREQEQNMSVDEENTFPTDTRESSTQGIQGADGNGQDKDQPEQDAVARPAGDKVPNADEECSDDIFVEVDEAENAKTMARILNIDGSPSESYPLPPPHPHDKFTKGQMPKIFDEDPATLLAGMEREQLQSWLELPTGKVLARPFDLEVRYKPNHSSIAKTLRAAVKEITGAAKVTVTLPKRDPYLPRDGTTRNPMTFLIHDISKKDVETLLERTVWSSKEITFQVSSIYVKRPDFLFTMEGMTTDNPDHVLTCIGETWNDGITNNFVRKLVEAAPNKEEQHNRLSEIIEFLESARIQHLDMRSEGGQEDPHYNIYANGEVIQNNTTWLELRKFLRSRVYRSNYHGDGRATHSDYVCSLCHGHDHPRGLCPFPHIPGWNGGGRNPKKYTATESYGTPDYRERGYNYAQASTNSRGNFRGRPNERSRGRGREPTTANRYPPY